MFAKVPIMLGQYRPLDSYLHRLDARAKLLPILLVMVVALLTDSILFYGVIMATLIVALLASGIRPRDLLRNYQPIILLVMLTSVYHLIFSGHNSEEMINVLGWSITTEALWLAGFYSMRLLLFVSIAFLMTLTNSPSELAEAFSLTLKPLAKLRIPVMELSMILFMAIRFIPVLYEEFTAIRNAQIIRGVDFSGSVLSRLKKSTFIIIPVFVSSIQRADDIALAMQARGYRSGCARTSYLSSEFGTSEGLFAVGSLVWILIVFVVTG